MAFVLAAKKADVEASGKLLAEVDDRLIVIIHVDGAFYCIDDVCTHDGGTLVEGTLVGCEIACPRHGAKFDIRSGAALTMPATEPTGSHRVKVDGEDLLVEIVES